MTHHRSRRGLAVLAAAATLAGGALTTVTTAAGAAQAAPQRQESQKLLDLATFLLQVTLGTASSVTTLVADLSDIELGDVLVAANLSQLEKLIPAADSSGRLPGAFDTMTAAESGDVLTQLTGSSDSTLLGTTLGALDTSELTHVFGTLTGGELTTILGGLTGGQLAGALGTLDPAGLTQIVGGLTPSQITGLLRAGGSASLIDGLLGSATALGGTPGTSAIDGLLGQVTALLGGGIPAVGDLTNLASLLGLLNPLLDDAGVATGLLRSLLTTANGLVGIAEPIATPLQRIITTINSVLAPPTTGGGTTGGGTTAGTTTTTTRPVNTTTARPGTTTATQAAAKPGPFRATIGKITVAKKRTSMKFTLSCPVSAPKGCLVQLSAKVSGQKAIRATTVALARGKSTPVTVTLNKSTAKRLKKKGGSLTVVAKTALSTLGHCTQTVKVKKPKAKRKKASAKR